MRYAIYYSLMGKEDSMNVENAKRRNEEIIAMLHDSNFYDISYSKIYKSGEYSPRKYININDKGEITETMPLTVADVINKLSLTTYINLIDSGHSVAYCKGYQINDNLKRRYVKLIAGESKYTIQIFI